MATDTAQGESNVFDDDLPTRPERNEFHQPGILLDLVGRFSEVIYVKPTPCRRCIRARFTFAPRFFPRRVYAMKLLAGANNRRSLTSFASPKDSPFPPSIPNITRLTFFSLLDPANLARIKCALVLAVSSFPCQEEPSSGPEPGRGLSSPQFLERIGHGLHIS